MRSYHVVTCMLAIFLLGTCMYGCSSSKDTDECVEFRTYNLESAQKVVPFTLILPNYLPSDSPEFPRITGPLRGHCSEINGFKVDIEYWSEGIEYNFIEIEECNYSYDLGDPALNPHIKSIEIGGFVVSEAGNDQGYFGSPNYYYSWNHTGISFVVEVAGYDHDEAIKVVESMIQQMQ